MTKKSKAAEKSAPKTESSVKSVKYTDVQRVIQDHNSRVEGMIKHHLTQVAESTGDLLPEDVSYVISLSNRELGQSIKQLFNEPLDNQL